jgi:hypothetical protein
MKRAMRVRNEQEVGKPVRLSAVAAMGAALCLVAAGCSSVTTNNTPAPTGTASPQTYFAGAVSGAYPGESISDSEYLSTYTIDDSKDTFSQSIYTFGSGDQQGPQLDYSGESGTLSRGWLNLGITYSNGQYGASANAGTGISYNPPLANNYAFELPDQAGGFVNLKGMPFVPIVPAVACPAFKSATAYQFVALPAYNGADETGLNGGIQNWNPLTDTAYGQVSIASSGSTVTFSKISQFTVAGTQVKDYPDIPGDPAAVTSIQGACSSTFYGNTISVPGQVIINNPGVGETIENPAIVGIGPSGLLLENDGQTSNLVSNAQFAGYQPFLGSGTGALGLPQPSAQIGVSDLQQAQFVGTIYGGGSSRSNWTSLLASFGFPGAPSGCPAGTFQAPMIGGDFPSNDPAQSPANTASGFGNCDVVIDLGKQDSANNGLFPQATVYLGANFAGNTSGATYSFPATAIAGQLNGKYAVFLVGMDTVGTPNQAWGIYLFQSN